MLVFLDTNILGVLSNPKQFQEVIGCQTWFERLLARGVYFVSSELCFYEVKRGLILAKKRGDLSQGLEKLQDLRQLIDVLVIDEQIADLASEIWSLSRLQGSPTASETSLDIDIIISAHWQLLKQQFEGRYVVIATTNVKHLSLFAEAQEWYSINY
jgi:predicted nucleic acid-binding protein